MTEMETLNLSLDITYVLRIESVKLFFYVPQVQVFRSVYTSVTSDKTKRTILPFVATAQG